MKQVSLLLIVVFLASCSTEIEQLDANCDLPVVYCLLNPLETTQYALVNKTYIGGGNGAMPEDAEDLQYQDEIKLSLELVNNGEAETSYDFHPISIKKDSGYFPGSFRIVYSLKTQVKQESLYRLVLYIPSTNQLIFSYTNTVSDFKLIDPAYPEVRPIHLLHESNPVFRWTPSVNSNIYQIILQFNYTESDSSRFSENEIQVPLNTVVKWDNPGNYYALDINSNKVYQMLSELIDVKLSAIRSFVSLDIIVVSGGNELALGYLNDIQKDPFRVFDFSNIKNGAGIFSSVYSKRVNNFQITDRSIDSLAYGRYTKNLNFLDSNGNRK